MCVEMPHGDPPGQREPSVISRPGQNLSILRVNMLNHLSSQGLISWASFAHYVSGCPVSLASKATSAGKAFMTISWHRLLFQYLATDTDTCMGLHKSNHSWPLCFWLFLRGLSRACCMVRFLHRKQRCRFHFLLPDFQANVCWSF